MCSPCFSADSPDSRKEVTRLLDVAFNAFADGRYEDALGSFESVLKIDPNESAALKGVKACQKKIGRKKSYSRKEKKDPPSVKSASQFFERGEWLDALDDMHSVLSRSPNQADALHLRNTILSALKERQTSLTLGSPEHAYNEGVIAYFYKRYEEASVIWRKSLEAQPDNLKLQSDIERAGRMVELAKKEAELKSIMKDARKAYREGRYGESVELWTKVVQAMPQDEIAQGSLAEARRMLDREGQKEKIAEFSQEGVRLYMEGDFAGSLQQWRLLLEVDPRSETAADYIRLIEAKGASLNGNSQHKTNAAQNSTMDSAPGKKERKP